MKDKIIKALECISGEEVYCEECSYSALYRYNFCIKRCAKDAIELINRLKRQCDKYRNKVQGQAGELRRLYKQNADYKAENERLKGISDNKTKELLRYNASIEELHKKLETAKAEAINEFAERLKEKATTQFWHGSEIREMQNPFVAVRHIGNLVKEMVGDVE